MNTTCFEDLCNELFFVIFAYVNPRSLHSTFGNLNTRFNDLLNSITDLQLFVNEEENSETIAGLASSIGLLQVNTWQEIDLNGFENLYALILSQPSPRQLKQIHAEIMPKLRYLSLFSNVHFTAPKQLIDDAFSNGFSSLRWARLGHIDSTHFRSTQSQSLRSVHISCSETMMIPFILSSCPKLDYLHVDIWRDDEKITRTSPILTNHPLRQLILRDSSVSISSNDILHILPSIPNLRKFELKFHCNVSIISLLEHFCQSLNNLNRFDCDITENGTQSSSDLITIHQIHSSFTRIRCRTQTKHFRVFSTDN